jgi:hypothetical protein
MSADERWFSWKNTAVTDRRYKVKWVSQKSPDQKNKWFFRQNCAVFFVVG